VTGCYLTTSNVLLTSCLRLLSLDSAFASFMFFRSVVCDGFFILSLSFESPLSSFFSDYFFTLFVAPIDFKSFGFICSALFFAFESIASIVFCYLLFNFDD
jgi:hypothetical protein